MELIDIKSFLLLEDYIREKNGIINSFECLFLEEVVRLFRERQLFFLVKNHFIPRDLAGLKWKYQKQIEGRYDSHQIQGVVVTDENGLFWMQAFHEEKSICYPLDFSKTKDKGNFYSASEFVPPLWIPGKNYVPLFEDDDVKIIVFLLQEMSCYMERENIGTPFEKIYLVFLENGFYVDLETPSLIRPYTNPYRYAVEVIPYSKMVESWSKEDFENAQYYYESQKEKLKEELSRKKIP